MAHDKRYQKYAVQVDEAFSEFYFKNVETPQYHKWQKIMKEKYPEVEGVGETIPARYFNAEGLRALENEEINHMVLPQIPNIDFSKRMKMCDWEAMLYYYGVGLSRGLLYTYDLISDITHREYSTVKQKLFLASREILKIDIDDF